MRTKGSSIVAVCAALVGGLLVSAAPAGAEDFSKPFRGFAPPSTVLRDGTPASVGLDPAPIATAVAQIRGHETARVVSAALNLQGPWQRNGPANAGR